MRGKTKLITARINQRDHVYKYVNSFNEYKFLKQISLDISQNVSPIGFPILQEYANNIMLIVHVMLF